MLTRSRDLDIFNLSGEQKDNVYIYIYIIYTNTHIYIVWEQWTILNRVYTYKYINIYIYIFS